MKPRAARTTQRRFLGETVRIGLLLYPERVVDRPRRRGDCVDGERPCAYAGCRYHLGFDVRESGSIVEVYAGREIWDMQHTCTLDIADAGARTLEEVGEILGLTRERVRQIELAALEKLQAFDLEAPPEALRPPTAAKPP